MPLSKDSVLNAALVVVATCALISTSVAAYRTLYPPKPATPPVAVTVDDWRSYSNTGHRFGPSTAPVTIVEFSDFECPFCRTASATLHATLARYPGKVAVLYRHYPLERVHRLARPAAIAAECADRQGAFARYHDSLFAQDSLGITGWTELATRVGIRDTIAFNKCLKDPSAEIAVDRDVVDAQRLKASGTPTLLVNQYRLMAGANPLLLDSLIQMALKTAK